MLLANRKKYFVQLWNFKPLIKINKTTIKTIPLKNIDKIYIQISNRATYITYITSKILTKIKYSITNYNSFILFFIQNYYKYNHQIAHSLLLIKKSTSILKKYSITKNPPKKLYNNILNLV